MWVPQLGAQRKHVPAGAALITDPRAQQYWDPGDWLDTAYGKVLKTPDVAWDVYLLYRRGVKWTDTLPPHPDFWMHQLSGVHNAPHLDPDVLRQHTEDLLR